MDHVGAVPGPTRPVPDRDGATAAVRSRSVGAMRRTVVLGVKVSMGRAQTNLQIQPVLLSPKLSKVL